MTEDVESSGAKLCSDSLSASVRTLDFWLDMWADEQADIESPDQGDEEERKIIRVGREVLKAMPKPDDYVAWLRWNGHTFVACDSDGDGAFKVCRHPFV